MPNQPSNPQAPKSPAQQPEASKLAGKQEQDMKKKAAPDADKGESEGE